MKKQFPLDILLVIILTLISIIFIYILPLDKYPLNLLFYLFLGLFLPGYALFAAIYPVKQELSWLKRILGSIAISATLALFLILITDYRIFGITISYAFIIIGILTIVLSIDALEGNIRNSKTNNDKVKTLDKNRLYPTDKAKKIYKKVEITSISF